MKKRPGPYGDSDPYSEENHKALIADLWWTIGLWLTAAGLLWTLAFTLELLA